MPMQMCVPFFLDNGADVCAYLVYSYMHPSIRFVHTYAHADVCVPAVEVYCARKLMVYLVHKVCSS
jgi:hypothetical protein